MQLQRQQRVWRRVLERRGNLISVDFRGEPPPEGPTFPGAVGRRSEAADDVMPVQSGVLKWFAASGPPFPLSEVRRGPQGNAGAAPGAYASPL